MSNWPGNRYQHQAAHSVPVRLRFEGQNQVQCGRSQRPIHFQEGFGVASYNRPPGMPPNFRTDSQGITQSRPHMFSNYSLPQQEIQRNFSFKNSTHRASEERDSTSQSLSNLNTNLAPFDNGIHRPPIPHWINNPTNMLGACPPHVPLSPPSFVGDILPPIPPFRHPLTTNDTGQNTPWMLPQTREGHSHNHPSKSHDEKDESEDDNIFIQQWLTKQKIEVKVDSREHKIVQVREFQKEMCKYLKYIEELKTCRNVLMQFTGTDEDKWQELIQKTNSIKENLNVLQSRLFQNDHLHDIFLKMKKRRKKRERQRRAREAKAKEKDEKQKRIILAHQRIDAWRHQIISKINAKRMVDSLKSEAGQSLAEVRKKIADCTKCLEKVGAIQELRGIRRQTALQRGIFIFGDQDEKFEKRIENMKSTLKQRLSVYNNEEKTLMVMLEEEQEQLKKEDDSKRRKLMEKEHMRLFGYDPLVECRRYWQQADVNPISLVQIRRLWDVYLVPNTVIGADRIPDGWVVPEAYKNPDWNKYIKKK